jgi:5,5'-dehydrodivanillate O-demethylase
MLKKEENKALTRVGLGTPAGKCCGVGINGVYQRTEGKTAAPTVLGEDLFLFLDDQNRLGLLALRCSHRGTSLEFGHLEDGGLRCCYHGWLYDVEGRVLEMPGEPVDSTFGQRVRHPAYKVQELGGVIFAYLGPEPASLLPRFDVLVRQDSIHARQAGRWCNFFQMIEIQWIKIICAGCRTSSTWNDSEINPQALNMAS